MKDSLIIWVPMSGSINGFDTLKFENVTNLWENDEYITFEYDGVSTKEHRAATFNRALMIGYAITEAVK